MTKEETRLKEPFYAGNRIKFDLELANSMELKAWQQDLLDKMAANRPTLFQVQSTTSSISRSSSVCCKHYL